MVTMMVNVDVVVVWWLWWLWLFVVCCTCRDYPSFKQHEFLRKKYAVPNLYDLDPSVRIADVMPVLFILQHNNSDGTLAYAVHGDRVKTLVKSILCVAGNVRWDRSTQRVDRLSLFLLCVSGFPFVRAGRDNAVLSWTVAHAHLPRRHLLQPAVRL